MRCLGLGLGLGPELGLGLGLAATSPVLGAHCTEALRRLLSALCCD